MSWTRISNLVEGEENPLVRAAGGLIAAAVWEHPLFQAVSDLEDRIGILRGELLPDEGSDPSIDPISGELLTDLAASTDGDIDAIDEEEASPPSDAVLVAVRLDPRDAEVLLKLADEHGRPPGDMAHELLHDALTSRRAPGRIAPLVQRIHRLWSELGLLGRVAVADATIDADSKTPSRTPLLSSPSHSRACRSARRCKPRRRLRNKASTANARPRLELRLVKRATDPSR